VTDFDLEEFKGAWAHAQHLEQERTKHLVLYFTILGALLAAVGFLLTATKAKEGEEIAFATACAIALVMQIITMFIFAAVRRLGSARAQHERVMRYLRLKLESDDLIRRVWATFSGKKYRWFSVQGAAEITLHVLAVALALGSTLAAQVFAAKLAWWAKTLVYIVPWLIVIFHLYLARKLEVWDKEAFERFNVLWNEKVQDDGRGLE
jgi:membrane protein YdbS with pleckstrin-like domain